MERGDTESKRSAQEYREFVRTEYERLSAAERRGRSRRLAFQELRLRLFLSLLDPLPLTAAPSRTPSSPWQDGTSDRPHL
jgi:hypothetical protein